MKDFPAAYQSTEGSALQVDKVFYKRIADDTEGRRQTESLVIPIRTGRAWKVPAGHVFRIVAVEGPQVGDLNMWNLHNPRERLWASRTRQLQAAHVTTYDRLWSALRAMVAPEAAGQRFIAAADFAWMVDLASLLRARLGAAAGKVPTRKVPDFVLRLAALFDRDMRAVVPRLGHKRAFRSEKAQFKLGWQPRPLEETVLDCARSLIAAGAV